MEALEGEVNNFLANSEEIDDLLDAKIIDTGNNTAVALVIYRKRMKAHLASANCESIYSF